MLDKLPNEIIINILDRVSCRELLCIRALCHRLQYIADIACPWQLVCLSILGPMPIYRSTGWRRFFALVKRSEQASDEFLPKSSIRSRLILRPLMIGILCGLFPIVVTFDSIMLLRRCTTCQGLQKICTMLHVWLFVLSVPIVTCYLLVNIAYAWCMQIPLCTKLKFGTLHASTDYLLPSTALEKMQSFLKSSQERLEERNHLNWKFQKLTAINDNYPLSVTLAADTILWCVGVQDYKLRSCR